MSSFVRFLKSSLWSLTHPEVCDEKEGILQASPWAGGVGWLQELSPFFP